MIAIEREGFMRFSWEARGVLRRAQCCGGIMVLPNGDITTVGQGFALTRRGAQRCAQRALKRWT